MKKALLLEDEQMSVVLIEGETSFLPLGKFIAKLSTSFDVWQVKYLNLVQEGLIPLKNLSSLLVGEIIKFKHLEKYATNIENFITQGVNFNGESK